MTSTNLYEKRYLTKSSTKNTDDIYVLILFKCDNTFAIKKKSNVHGISETDLVTIKERNKNYVGYCLFEGSLKEVEAEAERLDKEMNTDLESDCEVITNNEKSNQCQRICQPSTFTISNASNVEIDHSVTIKNTKNKKPNDRDSIDSPIRSLAMSPFDDSSKVYGTPKVANKNVQKNNVQETPRKESVVSGHQVLRNIQYLTKNKEDEETLSNCEEISDSETDDDQLIETAIDIRNSSKLAAQLKSASISKVQLQQSKQPSSFVSKIISHEKSSKRLCNKQLLSSNTDNNQEVIVLLKSLILMQKNLEKDIKQSWVDIKQLSVLMEKLDAKLGLLFENQKKIQRALVKRKINVALLGSDFDVGDESKVDKPFQNSLNYEKEDGTSIDLLQLYGVRTQLGRYVALVMDKIFTTEELWTIASNELIIDTRYNLIREAVRSRFKLNTEELNMEWPTIHESILQKRRNELKKKIDNTTTKNHAHLPEQTTNNCK